MVTAGSRQATRSSLVMIATVTNSLPSDSPAPATWATSWIEPPRNTPISKVE